MGNAVPRIRHEEATAPRSGAATARRHGGSAVRRPRGVEDERKAGVVMTVKVVVTRKEAERLIARLEERSAKERKARIAEITRRLRAGGDAGGGGSPVSCRGARLEPIQEI